MRVENNPKRDNLTINVICVATAMFIFYLFMVMLENRLAEIAAGRMV